VERRAIASSSAAFSLIVEYLAWNCRQFGGADALLIEAKAIRPRAIGVILF